MQVPAVDGNLWCCIVQGLGFRLSETSARTPVGQKRAGEKFGAFSVQ